MDEGLRDLVPCATLAVDSVIRTGSAGVIWGYCLGQFRAKKLGLCGGNRAFFIARYVANGGLACGLFAAIFSYSHCGMQRFRRQKDWFNTLGAGAVTAAAFGAGTQNWKQVAGVTCVFCAIYHFAKDS